MREQGLYRQQFEHDNCGIGAVVNSKGIKSHKTVENALKIVESLEPVKMQKEKPVMVLVSCFRFHTNFSRKPAKKRESKSVVKENTVLPFSSFRRMN